MDFLLQLAIVLACLFYGARKGGIALGLLGGIGMVVMTYAFHLKPGTPPVDVMLTIIAVVAASATLQASGGLDVLLQLAERILRRNPRFISILAPFTTCGLTMLCGTGHVCYTMLPIVYDVAIKNGIRPERPMAASLSISIPSTLAGVLAIGIFSWFRGKDLDKDEKFQAFIAVPENREYVYGASASLLGKKLLPSQWTATGIFIAAIVVVALLGAFESLRPLVAGKPISMILTIQTFMLFAGALIIIFTPTDAAAIGKSEVFRAGMIAVVAVFGIAWMADTMFDAHVAELKASLADVVKSQPWTYALVLLVVSKFVNSQAAAIAALVPVALSIGVHPGYVVAFSAACYGYYILPTYPSDLAAIQFDRSGTTHIGKYVINHSFILPGLIGVSTSCAVGYVLTLGKGLI